MTEPDEVDDTPIADETNTDQPITPAAAPPGDFSTGTVWESPSTYIAISSFLLPVLAAIFHKDFSAEAKALAEAAPIIAGGILMLMRNLHKREVIRANTRLAVERMAHAEQIKRDKLQLREGLQREATLALVAKLTAADAKKLLTTGETLKLPVAA